MSLSRRRFISNAAAAAVAPLVSNAAVLAQAPAPVGTSLPRIPLLDATQDNAFRLTAKPGATEFVPGVASPTEGFNQSYLGPIVRVKTGTSVQATVENRTAHAISSHWHGLLVTGDVDGGPHNAIAPGADWQPVLPIDQPPATLWYHTHLHGETGERVYAGLAGVLIVTDGEDDQRGLPSALFEDDIVLVIQDKRLDPSGFTVYQPTPADKFHGFLGNTIVVNGAVEPIATVPAGIVRLRLLNASNGRTYKLFFGDGRAFHLIATDQGFLPAPLQIDGLRLSPGERAELLVDFSSGGVADLMSDPHVEDGEAMMGMDMPGMDAMPPMVDSFAGPFKVIGFHTDVGLPVRIAAIPASIAGGDTPALGSPAVTRDILLNDMGMLPAAALGVVAPGDGGQPNLHAAHSMPMDMPMGEASSIPSIEPVFGINGQAFGIDRVDVQATKGSVERWVVSRQHMGHPFHVHGVRFMVASEGGQPPSPENIGWKDTVFVQDDTELLVDFQHAATPTAPFMFHCHVLEHEDRGMMGQLAVLEEQSHAYYFELVDEAVREGRTVSFSARLADAGTGATVVDATISVVDFNMEPEGMAGSNTVRLLPVTTPGVQPMQVDPDMSGRWALILKATTAGGEIVKGDMIVRVPD